MLIVGVDPEGSVYTARDDSDLHPYFVEGIGKDTWPRDDGPDGRRRVGARVRPRLVPDRAAARARGGAARRRLVGDDRVGGAAGRGAARAGRAGARDAARLGPLVPLEVPRRQVDARARLPRARARRRRRWPSCCARRASRRATCRRSSRSRRTRRSARRSTSMQRYSISQLPVVRDGELGTLADVIGSLQDRDLLDRVFKNADALHEDVASAMQPPLADGRRDRPRSTRSSPRSRRHERGARRARRPAGRRRHALRPARVPRPHALAVRGRRGRRRALRETPRARSPPPGWGAPPPSTASLTPPGGGLCNGSVPMRPQGRPRDDPSQGRRREPGVGARASACRAGSTSVRARVGAIPLAQLRRYVVAHQGYAARFRRARDDDVAAEIGRLQAVQLDSIATVDRAHRLTLASRIGALRRGGRLAPAARRAAVFEYWAHEACLLPIEDYPLFKRRMARAERPPLVGPRSGRPRAARSSAHVLARIRDEGALPARAFEGRSGPMWGWKPEKRALEHLFAAGELAIAGRQGFQRALRPARARDPARAPRRADAVGRGVPPRLRAARGRGPRRADRVAGSPSTAASRAACSEVAPARRRARRRRARRSGVAVDDGGPPVVVPAGAELDGAPTRQPCCCARSTT